MFLLQPGAVGYPWRGDRSMDSRHSARGGMKKGGNWWFGVEKWAVRLLGGWFLGRWLMGKAELWASGAVYLGFN